MSGKLYDEDLAKLIRESGDKHYRPSNGTEGLEFYELWCVGCTRERVFTRASDESGCEILGKTMLYDVADAEYPLEWTYDAEGQPCCTAFRVIPEDHKP